MATSSRCVRDPRRCSVEVILSLLSILVLAMDCNARKDFFEGTLLNEIPLGLGCL